MERDLCLGFHFKPTDQEILFYLNRHVNELPSPGKFILEGNLKYFRIDDPPDISSYGCLGRLYLYVDCLYKNKPGRPRDRITVDRKGYWKSTDGQVCVCDEKGEVVGYKQNFRFHSQEPGRKDSTAWVMTEYTIHSNKSDENKKAICVLRKTKEY